MTDHFALARRFDEIQPLFGPTLEAIAPLVLTELMRTQGGPIVELGCGTGSLLAALRHQHRGPLEAIGIERDPVLETLARTTHGITVIEADFLDQNEILRFRPRIVLAVRTLHYPGPGELEALYRSLAAELPQGAALINVDRFPSDVATPPTTRSHALTQWRDWWAEIQATPGLAAAFRTHCMLPKPATNHWSVDEHLDALTESGFSSTRVSLLNQARGDAMIIATA